MKRNGIRDKMALDTTGYVALHLGLLAMNHSKILADLISSATGAKTHYEVWWAQVNEAIPQYVRTMNEHSDFFLASRDAHYKAFMIDISCLFDKRSDSSSLPNYLPLIRNKTEPTMRCTVNNGHPHFKYPPAVC